MGREAQKALPLGYPFSRADDGFSDFIEVEFLTGTVLDEVHQVLVLGDDIFEVLCFLGFVTEWDIQDKVGDLHFPVMDIEPFN
jgi:hypothetical protein